MSQKTLQKKISMQRHIVFTVEIAPLEYKFCAAPRTSMYTCTAVYIPEKKKPYTKREDVQKIKEMLCPIDADAWIRRG